MKKSIAIWKAGSVHACKRRHLSIRGDIDFPVFQLYISCEAISCIALGL